MRIVFEKDPYQMNWLRMDCEYAQVKCPKELEYNVLNRQEGDIVYTEIILTNKGEKPCFTREGSVAISFPLVDIYDDSATCLKQRCHAHIFCGENVSYIMALRMGGEAPHLGMILTEGSLASYSVERNISKQSNDRGCFWLNASPMEFDVGETKKICWTIFPHEGKQYFRQTLKNFGRYIDVRANRYVFFEGEKIEISIKPSFEAQRVIVNGLEICQKGTAYVVDALADTYGEKRFEITVDGMKTWCRVFVHKDIEKLAEKRCCFIAEHQQYHGKIAQLKGAYLAYDNEDHGFAYDPLRNDCLSGRERVGMGALMAKYLQHCSSEASDKLKESLKSYAEFVLRELVDRDTGEVYHDIGGTPTYKRLYNPPWTATLFLELYKLFREKEYLIIACKVLEKFYSDGGEKFYAIGLPIVDLDKALEEAGMKDERKKMHNLFIRHADCILETDRMYPSLEVKYEQSIVAPAADILLNTYILTGEKKYLQGAERHIEILELFNGFQPDYFLYETAIRHWDGYWFGKRRMFGDTFPHYWSALTGAVFDTYESITRNEEYKKRSEDSHRGVLTMCFADGTASCAYLYPYSVNGEKGKFFEPYANDQDWGLYYYLRKKYREDILYKLIIQGD